MKNSPKGKVAKKPNEHIKEDMNVDKSVNDIAAKNHMDVVSDETSENANSQGELSTGKSIKSPKKARIVKDSEDTFKENGRGDNSEKSSQKDKVAKSSKKAKTIQNNDESEKNLEKVEVEILEKEKIVKRPKKAKNEKNLSREANDHDHIKSDNLKDSAIDETMVHPEIVEIIEHSTVGESVEKSEIVGAVENSAVGESVEKSEIIAAAEDSAVGESEEKPEIIAAAEDSTVGKSEEKPEIIAAAEDSAVGESKEKPEFVEVIAEISEDRELTKREANLSDAEYIASKAISEISVDDRIEPIPDSNDERKAIFADDKIDETPETPAVENPPVLAFNENSKATNASSDIDSVPDATHTDPIPVLHAAEKAEAKDEKRKKTITLRIGKKQLNIPAKRMAMYIAALAAVLLITIGFVFTYRVFLHPQAAFDPSLMAALPSPEADDLAEIDVVSEEIDSSIPSNLPTPTPDPLDELNQAADKTIMNGIVNVVLIGVDHAEERDEWHKYFYSDVMLVLAINFNENKVDMISIPRDTYTPIYKTKGKYKLNSSFYWGGGKEKQGYEYVCRSIETVLGGTPVPYYIGVDMPAVKQLVDMVGGVDFDVDMAFTIQGRTLETGMQHLNGQQVLDYIRARHKTSQRSDLQRVDREKALLLETFKQLKSSKKLIDVPKIFSMLSNDVKTNLSFEQLCALSYFGMKLDDTKIGMHTMPGKYAYMIYNWNYVILDQPRRVKLIKDIYGIDVPQMKKYSMNYCKREWATMQANKYLKIVGEALENDAKRPVETQKITGASLLLLNQRITELQDAQKSNSFEKIDLAKDNLKNDADAIFKALGIKADWFVNENPGLPRLTG